jgi:hypothetical protein
VPKADISLSSAGAPADPPAELSCHSSSERPRRTYLQKATTMRVEKMSGYAYGKINRYLVGASLQFS